MRRLRVEDYRRGNAGSTLFTTIRFATGNNAASPSPAANALQRFLLRPWRPSGPKALYGPPDGQEAPQASWDR